MHHGNNNSKSIYIIFLKRIFSYKVLFSEKIPRVNTKRNSKSQLLQRAAAFVTLYIQQWYNICIFVRIGIHLRKYNIIEKKRLTSAGGLPAALIHSSSSLRSSVVTRKSPCTISGFLGGTSTLSLANRDRSAGWPSFVGEAWHWQIASSSSSTGQMRSEKSPETGRAFRIFIDQLREKEKELWLLYIVVVFAAAGMRDGAGQGRRKSIEGGFS